MNEQLNERLNEQPQTALRHSLLKYWGYDSFRPLQAEAMQAVIDHRDSLVVLPTGGGKSICFQAPATTMSGLAIVVSPLISLMKDQVDALRECGIPAACINSSQSVAERQQIAANIRNKSLKLLYVAPERLCTEKMLDFLQDCEVSFFAIDEAHCISNWGHDFRPEYRMLRQLRDRFPAIGVHAYTATATESVRQDIVEQLGLKTAEVLVGSFDRPNLCYRVVRRSDIQKQVRAVIDASPGESGIVYCISRREVDDLARALQESGYKARAYHAGLSDEERHRHQDEFLNDDIQIIVATVAFGMGIDKSNVRFVIHTGAPKSLEHYQQETGRAGRDGLESSCTLIWSAGNFMTWRKMLGDLPEEAFRQADDSLRSMERFCNGVVCRHRILVEHFGQEYEKENCGACDVCLEQLDQVADPLVLAQKILSCVVRVKENFGPEYVAQVLTGSQEARIIANEHDKLTTWGLLKSERKNHVRDWLEQLISQGFLERAGDYHVLKVTPTGRELLQGKVIPRLLKASSKTTRKTKAEAASWDGVDAGLFEALRVLRRQIAHEHSVPPFVVFGDTTLRELARRRPTTLEDFRQIHGIGDKKTSAYGVIFLEAISKYAGEKVVSAGGGPRLAAKATTPVQGPAMASAARQQAFELFAQKKPLSEVCEAVQRAPSTIRDYLIDFIRQTGQTDAGPWVDQDAFVKVRLTRRSIPGDRLRPLYDALEGTISFDDLRIVVACLNNEPRPVDEIDADQSVSDPSRSDSANA